MFYGIWSWWAIEVFTLISSYMSVEALSAQTILLYISLLFKTIPMGLGIPTAALVSSNIVSKNIKGAKYFAQICFAIGLLWSIFSVVAVLLIKKYITMAFTSE